MKPPPLPQARWVPSLTELHRLLCTCREAILEASPLFLFHLLLSIVGAWVPCLLLDPPSTARMRARALVVQPVLLKLFTACR